MQLTINGEARDVDDGATLAGFLASINLPSRLVVVERNGEIVPREQFETIQLATDDVLEIVQMMAGG